MNDLIKYEGDDLNSDNFSRNDRRRENILH